jgi:hypothetical protein
VARSHFDVWEIMWEELVESLEAMYGVLSI